MQRVERSIRVKTPVARAYEVWRDFENFPRFMNHVDEVRALDAAGKRTHWRLNGPMGKAVEYDATLTEDEPNRSIAWNSSGGELSTTGNVTFTDEGPNTLVHVIMQWSETPGGAVSEAVSRLLESPEHMVEEDLRRFKDIAEGRSGSGLRS